MKIDQTTLAAPRIEMLPLIDIVFLLLVFFIYAMLSMAVHRGQPVDLPSSSSAVIEPQEAISVTIRTGKNGAALFLNKEPVSLPLLTEKLHRAGTAGQEVQIFADKTIAYQKLFQVLDAVKAAGCTHLSLQAVRGERKP